MDKKTKEGIKNEIDGCGQMLEITGQPKGQGLICKGFYHKSSDSWGFFMSTRSGCARKYKLPLEYKTYLKMFSFVNVELWA